MWAQILGQRMSSIFHDFVKCAIGTLDYLKKFLKTIKLHYRNTILTTLNGITIEPANKHFI